MSFVKRMDQNVAKHRKHTFLDNINFCKSYNGVDIFSLSLKSLAGKKRAKLTFSGDTLIHIKLLFQMLNK